MKDIVSIYGLDSKGRGIGRLHSKPVFVFNALPEEEVEITNIEEKSKYITADVLSYLKKSDMRKEARCPYYGGCGGCDLMHLSYEDQLKFKENKVKDAFLKVLKKDIPILPILSCNEFFYRNKAIFKVEEKIGYYGKKTHQVVPIEKCYLVNPKINDVLEKITSTLPLEGIDEIMIRSSLVTIETMVVLKVSKTIDEEKIVATLKDEVTTILTYENDYKVLYGDGFIHEKLGDFIFKISPDSFFQVNTETAYQLYSKVLEYVDENDRVVDLYCGTGSIGIFISKHCKKILGVEINESAVQDASYNKTLNQLSNIDFLCLNTSMFHQNLKEIDMVIIDPPRSGLDKKTVKYLLEQEVPKIVYVSCDLMTLIRDLGYFSEKYDIIEVTPVDMFPNTYHVENVVFLFKRENEKINL